MSHQHIYELHRFVLREIPDLRECDKVLDCGCGNGVWGYLVRAEKQGYRAYTVGLDIHRPFLEFCKKYRIYDELVVAEASQLPFRKETFDIILACQLIEHLDKDKGFRFLSEIERICKGKIIVSTHNGFMPHEDKIESEIHRSAWFTSDFKTFGWRVRGIGFVGAKPFFGGREKSRSLWGLLFYLFTPVALVIPQIGDFLIVSKERQFMRVVPKNRQSHTMHFSLFSIGDSRIRTDILDGSSRIYIELVRRWIKQGLSVHLVTSESSYELYRRYALFDLIYTVIPASRYEKLGVYALYMVRLAKFCLMAIKCRLEENTVIYSGSDFWTDSVPSWILKMRFSKAKWIAGFYLFAPNPFTKGPSYKGKRSIKGLLYYLSQILIYNLIKKYADMVWVTNELDRSRFIDDKRLTPNKVIAVRGGVDVKTPALIPEPKEKKFDAVFIGRFHPQKGVLELIDIWRHACERKKDAKLAVIGAGELEGEVREKIRKYGLENNVILFSFKDGIEKLKVFKDSKVVVHPAIYDSGGMAPCEAMACGLPGVSFDLPALKTYYPKGMVKTPCFDLKTFADNIVKLLDDEELYRRLQKEALELARDWDWDKRAEELLEAMKGLFGGEK